MLMEVRNCAYQVFDDLFSDVLLGKAEHLDEIEESERQELGNHVNRVIRLVRSMKFSDVRMVQSLPNSDLIDKIILSLNTTTLVDRFSDATFILFFEHFTAKLLESSNLSTL